MRPTLALILVFASVFLNRLNAANVWIKDVNDASTWPRGFAQVPQPASDSEITKINGKSETASDTAFDAAMRAKGGAFTNVYVGPGLFKTFGAVGNVFPQAYSPGFRLQDHARLIGAGKGGYATGGTTLLLVACNDQFGGLVVGANQYAFWDDFEGFRYTTATDIWVTDLQVDCNGPELTKKPGTNPPVFDHRGPWNIQAVQLWGVGGCHIERVHVKNAVSADNVDPIVENFILCINTPPGVSTGNVILDCSVTDFYNPTGLGGCSAISMNRWDEGAGSIQGIISGCDVVLNGARGWGFGGEFAYNASTAWGLVITNCTSKGAERAFNNDTFANFCLSLSGNNFEMPPGICFAIALLRPDYWSRCYSNTITLTSPASCGFIVDRSGAAANNTLIDHNVVIASGGNWTDVSWPYNLNDGFLPAQIPVNVHLEGNRVVNNGPATRFVTLAPGGMGYMSGNLVNGAAAGWPISQPNLGWTYTPLRADLLNDGTVDILLQDPAETIYAYSLQGSTAQTPITTTPSRAVQSGWQVVGSGDLNVDGQTDLILNHAEYGLGYWLLRGPTCIAAGAITYHGQPCLLGGTWKVAAVADFNNDGKPDLLLQDDNTYLGVWELNGTEVVNTVLLSRNYAGGALSPAASDTQGKWRAAGTGDFDANGTTDILFQYDLEGNPRIDGQLAVWYMDGVTVTATAILDPVRPSDPQDRVVATGDFTRRGAVDIVFQRKAQRQGWGGGLTLWTMDARTRLRRLSQSTVALGSLGNLEARNVVGPR